MLLLCLMEKGLKMIQAYQKILEMESIAELKLEQDRMAFGKN